MELGKLWLLTKTLLDTAGEMKFTGIEVYNLFKSPALTGKGGPFHPHRLAATVRQLRDRKLAIPCLDSSLDLTMSIADGDLAAGLIRTAQESQVPYVSCWASRDDAEGAELLRRNMDALLPLAEERSVCILIKTSGIFADTARLRTFLEQYASDYLGALWDMHHPYRASWVVPPSVGPRFPGPLLIRTRCPDTSPNSSL